METPADQDFQRVMVLTASAARNWAAADEHTGWTRDVLAEIASIRTIKATGLMEVLVQRSVGADLAWLP